MLKVSRPVRARGLKRAYSVLPIVRSGSRPVRARGLKQPSMMSRVVAIVAPRAGAWIETATRKDGRNTATVAPRAGAWIETCRDCPPLQPWASRPVRARGLKRFQRGILRLRERSRPVRARGLKPFAVMIMLPLDVAPRAGAWIETAQSAESQDLNRRAPCGRVD